jgi:hypothetical protein
VTTTRPDSSVETMKLDPGGSITSQTKQTTYPNGTVATQAIDPKTGTSTGLTIKDRQGKVTTALPDGKGGYSAVTKDSNGSVRSTTVYDSTGKVISQSGEKPKTPVGFAGQDSGEGSHKGGRKPSWVADHMKRRTSFRPRSFTRLRKSPMFRTRGHLVRRAPGNKGITGGTDWLPSRNEPE